MSRMGSRSVYRAVSCFARQIGKQKGTADDGFAVSRRTMMMPRWFVAPRNSANSMVSNGVESQQPTMVASGVYQTHSSVTRILPLQVGGTPNVVKIREEYPSQSASAELTKERGLEGESESWSRLSDQGRLATRVDAPENEPGSSPSSNSVTGERQAHSTHEARKNSVDTRETAKFAAIASTWWDPKGPYKPLHIMNPTRVSYVRSQICKHFGKDANTPRPLEGLKILDVGCGGGLVCEPLARMGGEVTGVDAVDKNIGVASVHAARDPATASIKYVCTTAEHLVQEQQKFDVVLALEVIEHVADPEDFCKSLAALAKKDGLVFISTLNRSIPSFGLAIIGAEYILGWLPKGTHEWSKFVTPEELSTIMNRASITVKDTSGMVYNPLTERWSISASNTSVNYIACGVSRNV
ncbi:uncharacterized protein [Physcomitrium patens]|uniref:Ubiquinone biosynthesis O-methyltransferase, mitochondrial n=1 Tax=Physcomitrium patens TaxID=3218 RepID=A0A2K1J8C2_PHYPA|nr:uncharacterized protein LOC112293916 [Physcomitrium patens]PNR37790.1 hypothetical protein PHYPA_020899 [Physcomitrium patens]|eukprot:XP_024399661.1 uncharacterized protein LOC112293916 [Physcomitrella patens]